MSCDTCSINKGGKPGGCQSNGGCSSGGCNRLNTYDWLSTLDITDPSASLLVEVSFHNGSFKGFFQLQHPLQAETRDTVVVDADGGYDIGEITLKGDLVRMQMKKKRVDPNKPLKSVLRIANESDIYRLQAALGKEKNAIIRSRAIARSLGLEMKVGEVIFRADQKKATFFYTADNRVDFRELIRHYAKEFRVKVEMKQIGARQESGLIGGLGSCGRELCCSTWLTHFKSVTTSAARYQNLAINQAKLSGQCGRLKCCLNYELDIYIEALEAFPRNSDTLQYTGGYARLFKTDIFKKLMFYFIKDERGKDTLISLPVDHVKQLINEINAGIIPHTIKGTKVEQFDDEDLQDEELTGVIELKPDVKKRNNKNRKPDRNNQNRSDRPQSDRPHRDRPPNNRQGNPQDNNQDRNRERNPNREQDRRQDRRQERNQDQNQTNDPRREQNRNLNPGNNQNQNRRPDRNPDQNQHRNSQPRSDEQRRDNKRRFDKRRNDKPRGNNNQNSGKNDSGTPPAE